MTHRLAAAIETHPSLGWLASIFSFFSGCSAWFIDHADDVAKVFGLLAAIFGCLAGYYTLRIQQRTWKRLREDDER